MQQIRDLNPAQKAELILRLKARKMGQAAVIPKRDPDQASPLSFAQQRMWFLDRLSPENPYYNLGSAFHLKGHIDTGVLEHSLEDIVQRHEILRTTFAETDGVPVQISSPGSDFGLRRIDLATCADADMLMQRVIREETGKAFDLTRGPLLRAVLVKLAADDHVLLIAMHHIISDGWSLGVFLHELSTMYAALRKGQQPVLPPLEIQYGDYAAWQREWMQGEVLTRQLEYWSSQLADMPEVLELSIGRPRSAVQSFRGAATRFTVAPEITAALHNFSRQYGVTLFMTLLAGYQTLLHRYSAQRDIVVGTPVANRNRMEIEGIIGFVGNTLVLRTHLGGHPTVRELVARVKDVTLAAYAHQDLPFERLVDELKPQRRLSHNPLFQTMFVLQNAIAQLELDGLQVQPFDTPIDTAKFDLTLEVEEAGSGLSVLLNYSTDLFDAATMERMAGHLTAILSEMVSHSEWRISELGMLAEQERRQILEQWNATAWEYERELSIAELFEVQVERDPEATAVVFEGKSLSYGELNERANQLGWYLRQQGVGPESRVGICLERSLDMVVSLLAVLKAGAAYVPLDAEYPAERLAFMAENAGVSALISKSTLLERLPVAKSRLLCLESEAEAIGQHSNTNLPHETRADNLAYIIYTSGSTGKPKGAMNTQGGLCNRLMWMQRMYGLGAEDRVLQKTPFSFDVSVWEFFWPLLWGARLVMARPGGHRDRDYLVDVIEEEGITTLHFVPSMLRQLLGASGLERCRSVKRVICSGEALPYEVASEFFKHFAAELHNLYGPSEAAIDVTYWSCEREMGPGAIPIGKPIANTQMYVLEENLEPAPVGVLGEIYIGGEGVGRGYWKQAGLTAERFVPNPFRRGERMYRTGDVGRWREDGNLEYAGRCDNQVKVRGFRIELGEIEAAMKRQAEVREAVVEVREDAPGDKRLVAYIVGPETVVTGLREALRQSLPEYMVPSSFMVLEELPLMPNGKLDRRALPAPGPRRPELEKRFEGPRNEVEQVLAGIWRGLLRLEQVGVHDNFFELGGDSILGIQVIARASQALGVHLTVKQLFQQQTIAELAAVVGAIGEEQGQAEQGKVEGEVELTPIQRWFLEQEMADMHYWNQTVLLEVRERLSAGEWKRVVQALLEQHDQLRASFHNEQGEWRQRIVGSVSSGVEEVPFRYVDCGAMEEKEFEERLAKVGREIQGSFQLSEGPLLRVVYFDRGERGRGRLLLVAHHLVVDGVSWRIVVEDVETACRQVKAGEELRLPGKTGSYQQWARRLVKSAGGPEWEADRAYWLAEADRAYWLGEAERPEMAAIAVDYQAGENDAGSMETISVWLEREETLALLQEVPKAYHTQINDALLAALMQGYEGSTGRRGMTIDLEGHGRETVSGEGEVEVSRTVGWFTSIFPVRLELPGSADVGEALKAIKEQLRRVPRHGMGYGLMRYCSPEKEVRERLAGMRGGEMGFNYMGQIEAGALGQSELLRLAFENVGRERSERSQRPHLIDLVGQVVGGRLHLEWFYSRNRHRRETMEKFAAGVVKALRALIDHCRSSQRSEFTPSDFPALQKSGWSITDLLALEQHIGACKE